MFARLGKVLYWLASGIAGLMLALGGYLLINGKTNIAIGLGLIAALTWLAGLLVLYVLAGG